MATNTTTTDYGQEKQEVQYVENVDQSPTDSSHELQKERTLEGIDMTNSYAVKGDDSDGKVDWSTRSIFAAIFLAALYTGTQPTKLQLLSYMLKCSRLTDHSLLHRRLVGIHRRGSWSLSRFRVASNGQYSSHRCCLPICWLSTRSVRQTLYCPFWLILYLYWLCARWLWAQLCSANRWHGSFRSRSCHWGIDWTCWVGQTDFQA